MAERQRWHRERTGAIAVQLVKTPPLRLSLSLTAGGGAAAVGDGPGGWHSGLVISGGAGTTCCDSQSIFSVLAAERRWSFSHYSDQPI